MFYNLINTKNGHNKFYMIYIYAYADKETGKYNNIYVSLQWGKIGTQGQTQHKEFKSSGEAINFGMQKLKVKLNKGYEIKETEDLREIADIPKENEKFIG